MQKVLAENILVREGNKTRCVPVLIALERVLVHQALKGDRRATLIVLRTAKDFGMLEQAQGDQASPGDILPEAILERLSDPTLHDIVRALRDCNSEHAGQKRKDLNPLGVGSKRPNEIRRAEASKLKRRKARGAAPARPRTGAARVGIPQARG